MEKAGLELQSLRDQVRQCETQLAHLKRQLILAESNASPNGESHKCNDHHQSMSTNKSHSSKTDWPLNSREYSRYGRQLIMPEVGLAGQLKLKAASILIVGVGGLGCPAAAYLAGAGVGTIGLVDGDTVDESNLHRQIIHSTVRIGQLKVHSATEHLQALNPLVKYVPHTTHLQAETALDLFKPYDLVLDCTDNPASRYLISDACVLLGKPLVSASALRTDGQLMVLNYPPRTPGDSDGGPCYRCMFPKPPPPESVVTCGDGGILGPVVGVMGVLQALEAIKLITTTRPHFRTSDDVPVNSELPRALLFSAFGSTPFRSFKMSRRRKACAACSSQATVTRDSLTSGSLDYVQFCGVTHPVEALKAVERISATEYAMRAASLAVQDGAIKAQKSILIDTRAEVQYGLCSLEGSINIPFSEIDGLEATETDLKESTDSHPSWLRMLQKQPADSPIYVVCRLGNDSQLAVQKLKLLGLDCEGQRDIRDIRGGLKAWRREVDPTFPNY